MTKRIYLIVLLCIVGTTMLPAQREKTLTGEAVYYCGDHTTIAEGKRKAEEMAIISALAEEYGTTVTSAVSSRSVTENGKSNVKTERISRSEVLGEWLGKTENPKFKIEYDEEGLPIVMATVKGRTRALGNAQVQLNANVLRNGTSHQHISREFYAGDDIYFCFEGNADGYLAVYLSDGKEATCLLPYRDDEDGMMKVKGGQHYIFFSPEHAPKELRSITTPEYYMTYEESTAFQKIYVIYSPKPFRKAVDHVDTVDDGIQRPNQLSAADFDKWLLRERSHDKEMRVETWHIDVLPR